MCPEPQALGHDGRHVPCAMGHVPCAMACGCLVGHLIRIVAIVAMNDTSNHTTPKQTNSTRLAMESRNPRAGSARAEPDEDQGKGTTAQEGREDENQGPAQGPAPAPSPASEQEQEQEQVNADEADDGNGNGADGGPPSPISSAGHNHGPPQDRAKSAGRDALLAPPAPAPVQRSPDTPLGSLGGGTMHLGSLNKSANSAAGVGKSSLVVSPASTTSTLNTSITSSGSASPSPNTPLEPMQTPQQKRHRLKLQQLGSQQQQSLASGSSAASHHSASQHPALPAQRQHYALKAGEELVHVAEGVHWVTPFKVSNGRVEISTLHIYFYSADSPSTRSPGAEDDIVSIGADGRSEVVPMPGLAGSAASDAAAGGGGTGGKGAEPSALLEHYQRQQSVQRWPLDELVEVHNRRYLLRNNAVELFFTDNTNIFVAFASPSARKACVASMLRQRTPKLERAFAGGLSPSKVFERTRIMEQWRHRDISNFEYIMRLNTIAGRSYNDITQYPVFPWVLADYTSAKLDLNDPKVFRDLSKPIGALNPERLQEFLDRYEVLAEDPSGIPAFHYGSHYSSAGVVLHFLVRVEPYTTLAIDLQGGRFDCPDRLFFSVSEAWRSSMESNSDVKELIPEFYYLPRMFANANHFDLGMRQDGLGKVDDVELPPWANGSPEEFVRLHRAALESEYVSAHLHKWIDLIFGYKQVGPAAVKATNVFYHLTYEGAVDLNQIEDPMQRHAVEAQIAHFGQTPSQLLKIAHPPRLSAKECDGALARALLEEPLLELPSSPTASVQTADGPPSSPSSATGGTSRSASIPTVDGGTASALAKNSKSGLDLHEHAHASAKKKPVKQASAHMTKLRAWRQNTWGAPTSPQSPHGSALGMVGGVVGGVVSGMSWLAGSGFSSSSSGSGAATASGAGVSATTGERTNPPLVYVSAYPDRIVVVHEDLAYFVHYWDGDVDILSGKPFSLRVGSGKVLSSAQISFAVRARPRDRAIVGSALGQLMRATHQTFASAMSGKLLLSCNYFDFSVRGQYLDGSRPEMCAIGHRGRVTCLSLSEDGLSFATGSEDCTVAVWKSACTLGLALLSPHTPHPTPTPTHPHTHTHSHALAHECYSPAWVLFPALVKTTPQQLAGQSMCATSFWTCSAARIPTAAELLPTGVRLSTSRCVLRATRRPYAAYIHRASSGSW